VSRLPLLKLKMSVNDKPNSQATLQTTYAP
jgi:hypothetical protein